MASVDHPQLWHCNNCGHSYYAFRDFPYPLLPQHLANTNNAPQPEELRALDTTLSTSSVGLAQDLDTLNNDITSLVRTYKALDKRREELELRLRACKSIASPLRRVPPEIIEEIIDWATAGTAVTLDTDDMIWACSGVSQMWRSVALSTPRFWSRIYINLDLHWFEGTSGYYYAEECVQTILSRAKHHPLSFEFSFEAYLGPVQSIASGCLELFVEHASQWREVSLTIPKTFLYILAPVRDCIPILERLTVYLGDSEVEIPAPIPAVKCFQNAPALHDVEVDSDLQYPRVLPWSQITEYTDLDASSTEWLGMMPNILSLDLSSPFFEGQTEEMELKKLRRLKLFGTSNIIKYLTLPALQELVVPIWGAELDLMIDLVERSQCCITELGFHLGGPRFAPDATTALIKFLKSLPSLRVLDLSQFQVENACSLLVPMMEDVRLLPTLTELILPSIHKLINAFEVLIPFFRQRRKGDRPIESVVFAGPWEPLSSEFKSLQQDGLCISFRA